MYSPCLSLLQDTNCDSPPFTVPANDTSQCEIWSECSEDEDEDNADFTDEKLTLNSTVLKLFNFMVHFSVGMASCI